MDSDIRQQLDAVLKERLRDRTHSQEAEWWKLVVLLDILDALKAIRDSFTRVSSENVNA
jgi:hypothetical protein